jgi:autotransporter-associated beta strand protein
VTIDGGLVSAASVGSGSGGGTGAGDGESYDGGSNAIFLQGDSGAPPLPITLSASAGETFTVAGVITDEAAIGGTSTGKGSIHIAGSGTVNLEADNNFGGGIEIESGTLELSHTHAAGSGPIAFDPGILEFSPSNAPSNRIDDFVRGDEIVVTGFDGTEKGYTDGKLMLTGAGRTVTLDIPGHILSDFVVGDVGSDTDVTTAACYCRGTLILTPDGEVPVEALAIGDRVVTLSGEVRPICWIGQRAYDGRFIAGKRAVLPIRITAGALADGVPAHDLWVSPAHSLYIDGVLVPAEHLVNGATIVQADVVERVEYFHIELDTHDVIFADGAAAETFVDCDNHMMFSNGAEYAALYPDDERPTWEFCLPRLEWGADALNEIRAALLWRAEALGHDLDRDPDLHLVIDGAIIQPEAVTGEQYRFIVPEGSGAIWLASRRAVPTEVVADSRDTRQLGVAVERIVLYDADLSIEAWHSHAALCDGFHEDEAMHRWTNGLARLPDTLLRSFGGAVRLELHLVASALPYRLPAAEKQAAAA